MNAIMVWDQNEKGIKNASGGFQKTKRYIATQEAGCTYASELQLAFCVL